MKGFECFVGPTGDISVIHGRLVQLKTGAVLSTAKYGAALLFPATSSGLDAAVGVPGLAAFVGGSGRNLIITGLTMPTSGVIPPVGFFTPGVADEFASQLGQFTLQVTGSSAATISDATDVVAILSAGGTAPLGSYASTSYGTATYNAGTAFSLTAAGEGLGTGVIPDCAVTVSAGSAVVGSFVASTTALYISSINPDWTIVIDPSGSAEMRYLTTVVATRSSGLAYDPSGTYEATTLGREFNPISPEAAGASTGEPAAINPFGVLTVTYSWSAMPDLDTGTTFLNATAGYGYSSPGPYLTFTGDNTTTGPEVVTVDLAAAWADGVINNFADVFCAADWYPGASPSQGHGPATLLITYSIGALTAFSGAIRPGLVGPSTTLVKALRVGADGSVGLFDETWRAFVQRVPVPPKAGYVYLAVTEAAGVLTAADGPFFGASVPSNSGSTYFVPIAHSDGAGAVVPNLNGAINWP